jgi:hypothetical protein
MDNKNKLSRILIICSIIRKLIIAKNGIAQISEVELLSFPELSSPLRETIKELELKILMIKSKVKSRISELEDFDESKHRAIDYISTSDIHDGFVDISKENKYEYYLNLSTGEIIDVDCIPEQIRDFPLLGLASDMHQEK